MRTWLGRGKSLQVGITACCLVAFVLFGYDQGVFSGILQNQDWLNQFDHPSDSKTGIIVSCYNLGCLLRCVGKWRVLSGIYPRKDATAMITDNDACKVNFMIGETLGRRRTIWLAMVFVIVGAVLQTSAFTIPHLVIGRVVTGVGTGLKTSTVPG